MDDEMFLSVIHRSHCGQFSLELLSTQNMSLIAVTNKKDAKKLFNILNVIFRYHK